MFIRNVIVIENVDIVENARQTTLFNRFKHVHTFTIRTISKLLYVLHMHSKVYIQFLSTQNRIK